MAVNEEDMAEVKSMLWANETVILTARQKRIAPGGDLLFPMSIIATDRRIIIASRAMLGLRKDVQVIPYREISSVRLERTRFASSVMIRMHGAEMEKFVFRGGREEGEITGLRTEDAKQLADLIDTKIMSEDGADVEHPERKKDHKERRYCPHCGTENSSYANYCVSCGTMLRI